MNHLTRHDYAAALQLLGRIEALADDVDAFERAALVLLNGYVACERTTLTVCDLRGERCREMGAPETIEMACSAALQGDPGHCIGLAHAIAMPLYLDAHTLVALVLTRSKMAFGERDRERLELLRPHLAFLYGHACRAATRAVDGVSAQPWAPVLADPGPRSGLTRRERDVLQWLACGKTDTEIAALLSISPRTVHKHLEHIYVKLGVETRTAAVMRALAGRPQGSTEPVQAFTPG